MLLPKDLHRQMDLTRMVKKFRRRKRRKTSVAKERRRMRVMPMISAKVIFCKIKAL